MPDLYKSSMLVIAAGGPTCDSTPANVSASECQRYACCLQRKKQRRASGGGRHEQRRIATKGLDASV